MLQSGQDLCRRITASPERKGPTAQHTEKVLAIYGTGQMSIHLWAGRYYQSTSNQPVGNISQTAPAVPMSGSGETSPQNTIAEWDRLPHPHHMYRWGKQSFSFVQPAG